MLTYARSAICCAWAAGVFKQCPSEVCDLFFGCRNVATTAFMQDSHEVASAEGTGCRWLFFKDRQARGAVMSRVACSLLLVLTRFKVRFVSAQF
jgi:hypothetical protein